MTQHFVTQSPLGFRGRRSASAAHHPRRWALAVLGVAVLFSTAGVAATRLHPLGHRSEVANAYSLPANAASNTYPYTVPG